MISKLSYQQIYLALMFVVFRYFFSTIFNKITILLQHEIVFVWNIMRKLLREIFLTMNWTTMYIRSGPYKDGFIFIYKTWLISDLQTSFLLTITIIKWYFIEDIRKEVQHCITDENMFWVVSRYEVFV